jgi:hypothetical protein
MRRCFFVELFKNVKHAELRNPHVLTSPTPVLRVLLVLIVVILMMDLYVVLVLQDTKEMESSVIEMFVDLILVTRMLPAIPL